VSRLNRIRWSGPSNIGAALLIRIVLFSSVVTLSLTALQLYSDYRHETEGLGHRVEQVARSYAPSLGNSLWTADRRQLRLQAEGILLLPGISAVDIRELVPTSPDPLVVAVERAPRATAQTYEFPILCDCDGTARKLGFLRIEVTHAEIIGQLLTRAVVIALGLGAKTFLVSLFTLFIVGRLITRHLSSIAVALATYDPAGSPVRFQLDRAPLSSPDELDRVVNAIGEMTERLHRAHCGHRETTAVLERREAELRQTAARLSNLIDNLPGTVFRIRQRPDGLKQFLWFGGTGAAEMDLARMTTLAPEDVLQLYHPDDLRLLFEEVPRRLRDEGFSEHRFRRFLPDGRISWRLARERVVDRDGDDLITEGLAIDVTEEMTAKQALERSESELRTAALHLRSILDNIPDLAWLKDTESRFVAANRALAAAAGVADPEALIGKSDLDFCPEELAEAYQADDRAVMATGHGKRIEERFVGADGVALWIETYKTALHDENGNVTGIAGIARDVSERRNAAAALETACQALRKSQQYYEELVAATPVGVIMTDVDGSCVFANDRMVQISGLSRDEFLGLGWRRIIHPDDRAAVVAGWTDAVATGGTFRQEYRIRRPEGEVLWVLGYVVPRFDAVGVLTGFIGSVTDITEQQLREEERCRLTEHIQETRKLEALGQLAGGIAHDFNNLLGAILGFARFIVEDASDGDIRYHAGRIVAAGQRGKALVEQILSFASKREVAPTRCAAAGLIEETAALLKGTLPSTMRLMTAIDEPAATIIGDAGQLGQVLLNLCINAHDALDGGPGTVVVALHATRTENEVYRRLSRRTGVSAVDVWSDTDGTAKAILGEIDPAADHVSLVVTDTGVGMDATLLEKIFTPFFTTKGKGHGTGLGLAVIERIVVAHHGALAVESCPGNGTRVEVILPRSHEVVTPAEKPPPSLALAAGGRILLVDDDPHFGDMLLMALERRGFEVSPCSSPIEALAEFRADPHAWDAVITDQTMPDMRGSDLVTLLRAIRPDLPCILCTGYTESQLDEAALRDAGITARVGKPVDMDRLIALLNRALAGTAETLSSVS